MSKKAENSPQLFENSKEFLTYKELSDALQMSERTLRAYVARGAIPFTRIGGWTVRFSRSDIAAWLRKRSRTP